MRGDGSSFAIRRDEIAIRTEGRFEFIDLIEDKGGRTYPLLEWEVESDEAVIHTVLPDGEAETLRFVPRVLASELTSQIELARLAEANVIASLFESEQGLKAKRVSLNIENGRFAHIFLTDTKKKNYAVLADVTGSASAETSLAMALRWQERLATRKKDPITEVWIAADRPRARKLQLFHALLREGVQRRVLIFSMVRRGGEKTLRLSKGLRLSDLWRLKPEKISLPASDDPTISAGSILALDPEKIDVIRSKQGETLRFLGLPFARVRKLLGRERTWMVTDSTQKPLDPSRDEPLYDMLGQLSKYRSPTTAERRHEMFRHAPEMWLESILKRDITALDANLILSPIYNQFRASTDRIDLLAIRRDGRVVIIEIKAAPDRDMVFQAADYWRKIELQRRKGELARAGVFGPLEILDEPVLVYTVAPALSYHRDFEYFAKMLSPAIEVWRFDLHEHWRDEIKVVRRVRYTGDDAPASNL